MIKFGLIGNPVSHSKSPDYFNRKFEIDKINAVYQAFKLDEITQLPSLINSENELIGLNVTSPFKTDVLRYVDILTPEAQGVGAVNTLYISRKDGKPGFHIIGHNTDVAGVVALLRPFGDLNRRNALILGSGGAARSVAVALQSLGTEYLIVTRGDGNIDEKLINYNDINSSNLKPDSIIIDATPLGMGMLKDKCPALPWDLIGGGNICIDLVYSPAVTPFLRESLSRGATVKNGFTMLIAQAEASWDFWGRHVGELSTPYDSGHLS